jgi:hypothetical protein
VDDDGRPARVPALTVETPIETRRNRAAELRRSLRRQVAEQLEKTTAAGEEA